MTNFTLHTPATAPEGSAATLAEVEKAWGFVPTMHATLAESPAALIGYETLCARIASSTLTPVEQQVAYQAVNVLHGCAYCTMGHTFLSRQAGMDEATIASLRNDEAPDDARLAALWHFTRSVAQRRGAAAAEVPAILSAGYSRANVLDVVAIIAAKTIANYTADLAVVPAEDFMSDPALAWSPASIAAA